MLHTIALTTVFVLAMEPEPIGQTPSIAAALSGSCPIVHHTTALDRGAGLLKNPPAPWGVQVAGSFSFDRALASFDEVRRKYPTIAIGQPFVVCSLDRSLGEVPIFLVRLPAADRQAATDMCSRLEAAGGACVVFRSAEETPADPAAAERRPVSNQG
jgi:sporulation related protein